MFDIIDLMLESLAYTSHLNLLKSSSLHKKLAMAEDPPTITG